MKNYRNSYLIASIGITSLILSFILPNKHTLIESKKGGSQYKVLTRPLEDGSFSISTYQTLYDSSEVDFETYLHGITENGLFFNQESDGSGSYGYMKTIVLPLEQRLTPDLKKDPRYPVKMGDWFYFNSRGEVDSVITFGDFKELSLEVDTGYDANENFYFIDSLHKIAYKDRKVIYKNK